MYIEDLITEIAPYLSGLSSDDMSFMQSISRRISNEKALTTKQSYVALKILKSEKVLEQYSKEEYRDSIAHPIWKRELIESTNIPLEVRYLGDNLIGFRGQVNRHINSEFKKIDAHFSNEMKIVQVRSITHLEQIVEFIGSNGYQMDSDLENYLVEAYDAIEKRLTPVVTIINDKIVIDLPNKFIFAEYISHSMRGNPSL